MLRLSGDASRTYLSLSVASHQIGHLSRDQLISRLLALRSMCQPSDAAVRQIQGFIEREPEMAAEDEWPDGEPVVFEREVPAADRPTSSTNDDDDVVLHFIPGPGTGLSSWVFHPFDVDYFPSVPHGHFQGKPHPKLDAYLGWVYQGSRQIRRETRARIISLWNDSGFRNMAQAAVNFYLTRFPQYAGWRVQNPRVLPRRRRP
jgi:hypothetical protein